MIFHTIIFWNPYCELFEQIEIFQRLQYTNEMKFDLYHLATENSYSFSLSESLHICVHYSNASPFSNSDLDT